MKRTSNGTCLLTLLAALAAASPAAAATVEVLVRDSDGRTLANEIVSLKALSSDSDRSASYILRHRGLRRATDSEGTATFEDLAPGT